MRPINRLQSITNFDSGGYNGTLDPVAPMDGVDLLTACATMKVERTGPNVAVVTYPYQP